MVSGNVHRFLHKGGDWGCADAGPRASGGGRAWRLRVKPWALDVGGPSLGLRQRDSGGFGWSLSLGEWSSGLGGWRSGLGGWRSTLGGWSSGLGGWRSTLGGWSSGLGGWRLRVLGWGLRVLESRRRGLPGALGVGFCGGVRGLLAWGRSFFFVGGASLVSAPAGGETGNAPQTKNKKKTALANPERFFEALT